MTPLFIYRKVNMNPLFIYRNAAGTIKVEEIDYAKEDNDDWEHIATIEQRLFLESMFNKEPEIVERWMK